MKHGALMKTRCAAGFVGLALLVSSLAMGAAPALAATTWTFPSGSFTLSDVVGGTGTLTIQNLQVSGSSATGRVALSNGGRSSCSTQSISGLTATFTLGGQFDPCYGTVTFAIDGSGNLTVSGSSVYIPTSLLTGPGSGSVKGSGPEITSCSVAVTDDQAQVSWEAKGSGITDFDVGVVNGQRANVTAPGTDRQATVSLAGEQPGQLRIAIQINGDGGLIFPCADFGYFPSPGKPSIDSLVPAAGGLLSVNYSLADPITVQGIEYAVDNGVWARPGGQAPVAGSGGSFSLSGLSAGKHTVTLRSVGFDSVKTTEGAPRTATVPASASSGRPITTNPGLAIGSPASKPIPAPPVQPVSVVSGTSNGAGSGANGALASNTGDAGIDAPCLAKDGTLYPNQYSTVGSQLTMAPNTHGLGNAKEFTVIGGSLAPGMQLDRTYGVLFGVTAQAGSWVTTIRASFADGSTKSSEFTTRVDADAQTLQYAAQNIGTVGTPMSIEPSSNGPAAATNYSLVCGTLPAGMTLDPKTGFIVGKPTSEVALPTPLRVAQTSPGGKASASFILVVGRRGSTSISYPAHPHIRAGKRVSIRPTVAGVGEIALFRMWKGKLPRGLHLNAKTGVISGRAARSGPTHTITIVAVTRGAALLTAAPTPITTKR